MVEKIGVGRVYPADTQNQNLICFGLRVSLSTSIILMVDPVLIFFGSSGISPVYFCEDDNPVLMCGVQDNLCVSQSLSCHSLVQYLVKRQRPQRSVFVLDFLQWAHVWLKLLPTCLNLASIPF